VLILGLEPTRPTPLVSDEDYIYPKIIKENAEATNSSLCVADEASMNIDPNTWLIYMYAPKS